MKKNYVFIALAILGMMFASCTSKEQKAAVEYLQNSMKSPSSFKVINVEVEEREGRTSYDTLFHIGKVYAETLYGYRIGVDSVLVDSMKIWRIEYPACKVYDIEYDAANSYGAIIRDTEEVYVVNENEIYFFKEFISKYVDEKVFDHTESCHQIYSEGIGYSIEQGKWVYPFELRML